ncbi:MAG TPA: hypothetical protein VNC50_07090, partial [Planctomycetia bacterium]|nr:hypothetical protein [Planctomycetia bacterium]
MAAQTTAETPTQRAPEPAPFYPQFPLILTVVDSYIKAGGITEAEFIARREEILIPFAVERPPTARLLAAIHDFVLAECMLEYWDGRDFDEDEETTPRTARGVKEARRRYEKAQAALEREERSREKARALLEAAREKRAFIRERDERRFAEERAVRIEKHQQRLERDHQNRLERKRQDAERATERGLPKDPSENEVARAASASPAAT